MSAIPQPISTSFVGQKSLNRTVGAGEPYLQTQIICRRRLYLIAGIASGFSTVPYTVVAEKDEVVLLVELNCLVHGYVF